MTDHNEPSAPSRGDASRQNSPASEGLLVPSPLSSLLDSSDAEDPLQRSSDDAALHQHGRRGIREGK